MSLVTFQGDLRGPGKARGTRSVPAENSNPSGVRCTRRRKVSPAHSRLPGGSARPARPPPSPGRPIGRRAGGGATGRGGAGLAAPRSARQRAGRAPLASRGYGAADLAFRRRRGRGRVPGVSEVRLRLGWARRSQAGRVPLAGGVRGQGCGGRGQGPGARPLGLPESVPRRLGVAGGGLLILI